MRCDLPVALDDDGFVMFQSLSGFLMRCDGKLTFSHTL